MSQSIINRNFVIAVSKLVSGAIGAQIINLLAMPIITRAYTPEALGQLNIYVSSSLILSFIMPVGFQLAMPLAKDDKEVKSIESITFYSSMSICILLVALIWGIKANIDSFEFINNIGYLVYLIPIGAMLQGWSTVSENYCYQSDRYNLPPISNVTQSLINNGLKIILSKLYATSAALIISTFSAYVTRFFVIKISLLLCGEKNKIKKEFGIGEIEIINKYKDFPKYRLPQMFINTFSQHMPLYFLGYFFSNSIVGFFGIANTVLALPISLLGTSISNVLYPKFAKKIEAKGSICSDIVKAMLIISAIALVPFLILALYSSDIFGLVFGDNWRTAGQYASCLAVNSYFMFLSRPIISAIPVLKLQKQFLMFEIFSVANKMAALLFGVFVFNEALVSVFIFSIVSAFMYILLSWFVLKKSKVVCDA